MKVRGLQWQEKRFEDKNVLFTAYTDLGRITVLDRLTGFGYNVRDIETGYMDNEKHFWLKSGQFDIMKYPELTIQEAVEMIKNRANTCTSD